MPNVMLTAFVVIGFVIACHGLSAVYRRFISGKWVKIIAKAAYAGVDTQGDQDFSAWLVYDYIYSGKNFRSPRTRMDWPLSNERDALTFERMWNAGRSLDIWVNDKSPHNSLVSLDRWMPSALFGSIGLLFCMIGAYNIIKNLYAGT